MILVDTSAWIDYFQSPDSPAATRVYQALDSDFVIIGDLVYCEVMQGIQSPRFRKQVDDLFTGLNQVTLGGFEVAKLAAQHYRILREKGVTIRKTIDCIIATFCIKEGIPLIHSDKDFDPFVEHLGLLATAG